MEVTTNSKYITIINNINGFIMDKIELNDSFYNNLNLFLDKYRGYNEDYAKLMCNDRLINSLDMFKVNNDFIMPDNTDIIYMIKSYKKNVYLINDNGKYKLNKDIYYIPGYDKYFYILLCFPHIIASGQIIKYSYRELILSLLKGIYDEIYDDMQVDIIYDHICNMLQSYEYDDYNLMLYVCSQFNYMYKFISYRLENNEEFTVDLITQNPNVLNYVNYKMKNNYNVVLAAVNNDALTLQYASVNLQDNYDIVLAAVKNNSNALNYASDRLINNCDIVLTALVSKNVNHNILRYVGKELMDNYKFVAQLIKFQLHKSILEYVSNKLKDNYKIVLAAVKLGVNELYYASIRLKDNYKVVLAAVKKDKEALKYASIRLKDNYTIVFFAVLNDVQALQYASNRLRDDYSIVLTAIKNNAYGLSYASTRLKDNYDIVLAAVTQNNNTIQYASDRLQKLIVI